MLTKEEMKEVFSNRKYIVEDIAKEENWFFFTKDEIHYEVQIDIDKDNPNNKILAILCPCMGKVGEEHGYLLEQAVDLIKKNLKDEGIEQYQLNYHPEDCSIASCMMIYYENYSKEDLDNAIASAFEIDDLVNEVIQRNIMSWIEASEFKNLED